MRLLICIPVQDGLNWTLQTLASIRNTVRGPTDVLVFDNASLVPYDEALVGTAVRRVDSNIGYYAPLKMVAAASSHDVVALCHNDLIFYEVGWDVRLLEAFDNDRKLGVVGLCGSDELDGAGGRGGGTMCFFRGDKGQPQHPAGKRVTGLHPAIALDSLFMAFRSRIIDWIESDWDNLPLAHFYDKIWPCRAYEQGWRTAVLGSECDHAGGVTTISPAYGDDCKRWFDERPQFAVHIDTRAHGEWGINYTLAMYYEAEQRFLSEYRDKKKLMPCRIDKNYVVKK